MTEQSKCNIINQPNVCIIEYFNLETIKSIGAMFLKMKISTAASTGGVISSILEQLKNSLELLVMKNTL